MILKAKKIIKLKDYHKIEKMLENKPVIKIKYFNIYPASITTGQTELIVEFEVNESG